MMRNISLAGATLALGLLAPSAAATDRDDTLMLAHEFSMCGGFWDWMATVGVGLGKPASAEHLHNMGNGARSSAQLLYARQYLKDNPEAKPKPLGTWADAVKGAADAELVRLRAVAEMNEGSEAPNKLELEKCTALTEYQGELIQQIRDSYSSQKP